MSAASDVSVAACSSLSSEAHLRNGMVMSHAMLTFPVNYVNTFYIEYA